MKVPGRAPSFESSPEPVRCLDCSGQADPRHLEGIA